MQQPLLNLRDYSPLELITFGVGCAGWIIVYGYTLHSLRRHQFIEIPVVTVWGNIVWEFLWSFVFITDMGLLFVWGYRIWFFLDCFIVYGAFRYGHKQVDLPLLRRHFRPVSVLVLLAWIPLLYFYIDRYDAPLSRMGAYSGYLLNLLISALYIPLALRLNNWALFSYPVAWYKGIGTLLISLFCFLHFSDGFLLTMCVLTGVLDGVYIYLFHQQRGRVAS